MPPPAARVVPAAMWRTYRERQAIAAAGVLRSSTACACRSTPPSPNATSALSDSGRRPPAGCSPSPARRPLRHPRLPVRRPHAGHQHSRPAHSAPEWTCLSARNRLNGYDPASVAGGSSAMGSTQARSQGGAGAAMTRQNRVWTADLPADKRALPVRTLRAGRTGETTGPDHSDAVIMGGGVAGPTPAPHLRKARPGVRVRHRSVPSAGQRGLGRMSGPRRPIAHTTSAKTLSTIPATATAVHPPAFHSTDATAEPTAPPMKLLVT